MHKTRGKIVIALLFLTPILVFYIWRSAHSTFIPLKIYGHEEMDGKFSPWTIRDFNLVNQDGDSISLKDLEGKIIVANFFYASCPEVCPRMNNALRLVVEKFKTNEDIVFLSHTVDPERDSQPILKKYAKRYAYKTNKWHFLTGSKTELYDLGENYYRATAIELTGEDFLHSTIITLVDPDLRIRGFFESNDNPKIVNELKDAIKVLQKEYYEKNKKVNE